MVKKICIVGTFAVGKTSLINQFVYSTFSDKYLSTIGVKISKKVINIQGKSVSLMIWDMEGQDIITSINVSYLQGASGFFVVVDSTRKETFLEGIILFDQIKSVLPKALGMMIVNKSDLEEFNELTDEDYAVLKARGIEYYLSSAKTGANVKEAFCNMASGIIA